MKRIISAISIFSLIAMFAFGCTPADTTKNNLQRSGIQRSNTYNGTNGITRNTVENDGTLNDNGTANNAYTRKNAMNNNYLTGDYLTNDYWNGSITDKNIDDNNGTYRNAALGDTNKISSIKNVCNRKANIEDTSVAINNDTAYVGLDLDNNANLTEKMKEDLSTEIKRVDPSITKVYFTEDRGVIDNFVNSAKNTAKVDWSRLQNIFR